MNADEDVLIPPDLEIQTPLHSCNVKNLSLFLLAQRDLVDPFSRTPLSEDILNQISNIMGVAVKAFVEIWTEAKARSLEEFEDEIKKCPLMGEHLELFNRISYATQSADYETDSRFRNLHSILSNEIHFTSKKNLLEKRTAFLTLLKTSELWNSQIEKIYSPKKNKPLI